MATRTAELATAAEPEECDYDLREDVLQMISNSRLSDFRSSLEWAHWCRQMAVAGLNQDGETVSRMFSIDSSPRSGE